MDRLSHPFPPLYDAESRILILGSFPSVKSREAMFFYGHPQNRFWRVVSTVLGCDCPRMIEEKRQMLHAHHIALWDVIASCRIEGSSDSSIRDAVPTNLSVLLAHAPIRAVFCNGQTAFRLYGRYQEQEPGLPAMLLPSTSPANAAYSVPRLLEIWRIILPALQK
mgnify:CR=1 FL=1